MWDQKSIVTTASLVCPGVSIRVRRSRSKSTSCATGYMTRHHSFEGFFCCTKNIGWVKKIIHWSYGVKFITAVSTVLCFLFKQLLDSNNLLNFKHEWNRAALLHMWSRMLSHPFF